MSDYDKIELLIKRHHKLIEHLCRHASHYDAALSKELLQECFFTLWRRRESLRHGANPIEQRAWMVWQCRSAIEHYLRRRRHWQPIDGYLSDTLACSDNNAQTELLEELAADLDARQKMMLSLIIQGFTTDEIAAQMGITLVQAKSLRRSMMTKMKATSEHIKNNKK